MKLRRQMFPYISPTTQKEPEKYSLCALKLGILVVQCKFSNQYPVLQNQSGSRALFSQRALQH